MIKRLVFFLLIFCLPFQLGYHFWLPQSFVHSFRVDYLAPTLYFTDIVILAYLALNLKKIKFTYLHLALLVLIALNITVSTFNHVTILAWLRLVIYYLLFLTLRQEINLKQKLALPFLLSLVFVLTLEFLQLLSQHSLGGLFWLVGERNVSIVTPNVAKLTFDTLTLLRPYATFSHPNSLAGYLLICLLLLPLFSKSKTLKYSLIAGIILTFSKAAWLALLFPSLLLVLPLNVLPLLSHWFTLPPWLSLSSRLPLLLSSAKLTSDNLIFGVGLRQFIPQLGELLPPNQISYSTLQPVHNIILLAMTELGIIPLAIFLLIFFRNFKKIIPTSNFQLLTSILLITGAVDHYWWTLPQNQLIIILALALLNNNFPRLHKERVRVR